jgi:hypothetical protein
MFSDLSPESGPPVCHLNEYTPRGRPLRRGAPARILRGPLRELEGLYAGQAAHERVAVLLSTLGRVTLARQDVEAI